MATKTMLRNIAFVMVVGVIVAEQFKWEMSKKE